MHFRAYFKHMPTSTATYAYAELKLGKQLEKHSLRVLEAHVTFWVEDGLNKVSCHVVAANGIDLAVAAEDETSMNAAIDALETKIGATLRKAKGKRLSQMVAPAPLDTKGDQPCRSNP